jgi:hypothetical protein
MNDRAIVDEICRPRQRSKGARVIGGLIVGTNEEVPAGKQTAPATANHDDDDVVLVRIKVDRKTHTLLREMAKANGTGVQGIILRSIKRAIHHYKLQMAKKP